jgi:hypothetical protein
MATITLISTGTWDATNTTIWSPAQVPTSSDDVIIASGFTVNCASTGCVCNNITYSGGQTNFSPINVYGNVVVNTSYAPRIIDYSNLILNTASSTVSCMDVVPAKITSNAVGVSATSNIYLSALVINASCSFVSGNYDLSSSHFCNVAASGILSMNQGKTLTLNISESSVTDSALSSISLMTGVNVILYMKGNNLSYDCTIGDLTLTTTSGVNDNMRRSVNIGGNSSSLTVNGTGNRAVNIQLKKDIIISGNISISSSDNSRVYVKSSIYGINRILTCNGIVSIDNTIFMDITGSGSANWNLSSSSDVGDGGNNSGITFSSGVNKYWVASSGGNWNDRNSWSLTSNGTPGANIPLPQDSEMYDQYSITSTGRTISFNALNPIHGNIVNEGLLNSPILHLNGHQYFREDVDVSGFGSMIHNNYTVYFSKLLKGLMIFKANDNIIFYSIQTIGSRVYNYALQIDSNINMSGTIYASDYLSINIQSYKVRANELYHLRSVMGNGVIEINSYMYHAPHMYVGNNNTWTLKLSGSTITVDVISIPTTSTNILGNLIIDCSASCTFINLNTQNQSNILKFNNIIFQQPGKPFTFYGEGGTYGNLRISAESVTNNSPDDNPVSITASNGQGKFDIGTVSRDNSLVLDLGYANLNNITCPTKNSLYAMGTHVNTSNVYNHEPRLLKFKKPFNSRRYQLAGNIAGYTFNTIKKVLGVNN